MAGGVARLWRDWAVQILVLLSFSLQAFLFIFAGIRRRNASRVLRLVLWLAYLAADSTATYTIGHLSISNTSHMHELVPFWAPFLLLHLGGQDTITAYALEDNRLWLRHLQTLVVQVLGASYVAYSYIYWQASGKLISATILMLVVGVAKYGERIWALRCANNKGMNNFLDTRCEETYTMTYKNGIHSIPTYNDAMNDLEKIDTEESILHGGHTLLGLCVRMFLDHTPRTSHYENGVIDYFFMKKEIYKVIQIELSLIYDIIYTKARVIHTWYGLCIRVTSLLAIVSTFFLFQIVSKDGCARVDVAITYILLVGAVILEMVSGFSAILSTWTRHYLYTKRWHRLYSVTASLRLLVKAEKRRTWPMAIGQFNMLSYCSGEISVSKDLSKVKINLPPPEQVSTQLQDLLLTEILRIAKRHTGVETGMNTLGQNPELPEFNTDFDTRIIIWHTATDAVLFSIGNQSRDCSNLAKAIKMLSDYLMFLLAKHPEMLPGPNRRPVYAGALVWLHSINETIYGTPVRTREELAQEFLEEGRKGDNPFRREKSPCKIGAEVAVNLLDKGWDTNHLLQAILGLWVEMLCYAGSNCSMDAHARRLSTGGEFLTIVWLLTRHAAEHTRYRLGIYF